MINPLLKYVMKDKKEDVVHSSAYGKAQNEGGFGVASTQSFEERKRIEENRQNVRGYRDARVVSDQGRDAWRIRQEARRMEGAEQTEIAKRTEGLRQNNRRDIGYTGINKRPSIKPDFMRKK